MAKSNHNASRLVPFNLLEETITTEFLGYVSADSSRQLDSITFAGNGEPTLHAAFLHAVELVAGLRNELLGATSMHLFTDGLHLALPDVQRSLPMFRRIFLKLDGASASMIHRLNGPTASAALHATVETARDLPNIAASTMLLTGELDNVRDVASPAYAAIIRKLNPREVFLYTLDYPSANANLKPVCRDVLMDVAEWLAQNVPCPVVGLWRIYRHPAIDGQSYNA